MQFSYSSCKYYLRHSFPACSETCKRLEKPPEHFRILNTHSRNVVRSLLWILVRNLLCFYSETWYLEKDSSPQIPGRRANTCINSCFRTLRNVNFDHSETEERHESQLRNLNDLRPLPHPTISTAIP